MKTARKPKKVNWFWTVWLTGFPTSLSLSALYLEGLTLLPFLIVPGIVIFWTAMPFYAIIRHVEFRPFHKEESTNK